MEITPETRTITNYTVVLTDADAAELVNSPYNFADRLRNSLLPHLPQGGVSPRKPGKASQITIGKNGNGHKRGPKGKAPKGAGLAKVNCPECGKPVAAKFLPLHQAKKHGTASGAASSSSE